MNPKSRFSLSRSWPWLLLALLIVAAVVWRFARSGDAAPEFLTATADRGTLVARVTATGTLSALVTVQVGSQVSGRIQELFADFNSPVKKGQLIATIDARLFDAEVQQAHANVQAAEANLLRARVQAKDARRQAQRAVELAQQGLLSKGEGDTALANADAADASVVSAQAAVVQARASQTRAETNLAYTRISSPTDGVVISRSVDVGQTVAASMSAPILFTIAQDLRQMQVNTSVAESDVGRLRGDMPASFTVDAYPGERFQGKVRQVRDVATTLQNVVTYDAVIDVDNPDLKLKPGMTANVTFVYARREDSLRVPNAALRFRPPEGLAAIPPAAPAPVVAAAQPATAANPAAPADAATTQPRAEGERGNRAGGGMRGQRGGGSASSSARTVWVLRNEQLTGINVTTGISDGSFTEIVSGDLKEGDTLVTDVLGMATTAAPAGGPALRMF